MRIGRPWGGNSRTLTALFLAVLVPPSLTLIWLGVRLLDQDRTLAVQRDLERRQAVADKIVRSLDLSLSADPNRQVPDGAVRFAVSSVGLVANPVGLVLWLPVPTALPQGDPLRFTEAEKLEYQGSPDRALSMYQEMARSPQIAIQAGALLRLARVLRGKRRVDEAIGTYRRLAALREVAIDGMPVDLLARRALAGLLQESGRSQESGREAALLEADFVAGRWMLDRTAWELVADQIAAWVGHPLAISPERKALSAAGDWIWEEWRRLPSTGRRLIPVVDGPVTLVWRTEGATLTTLALSRSVFTAWLQKIGEPASLLTESGEVLAGERPATGPRVVRRPATETGLPWNLVLNPGETTRETEDFAARRRLLSMGLGAIVLLLSGGSYLLLRVVRRELAVVRLQTDFVAAVSHEFRTPLTSLHHITELLEEDDELPAQQRKVFYGVLGRSTDRLHRLVESLLDFSRMDAGRKPYDMQPVDAGEIAAQVVADFQKEVEALGYRVDLEVEAPSTLRLTADASALTQALRNLLDNAIKYSPGERDVWVSVRSHPGGVAISVRDRGMGIPPRERKEIFRKFLRGSEAKRLGIKGTGLGLAMVSHIVRAHGGTVELESEEGRGSTFRLVLPAGV